jgi:hypothetical protein
MEKNYVANGVEVDEFIFDLCGGQTYASSI